MKKIILNIAFALIALIGCLGFNMANNTQNLKETKGFAVVELYTSEGCSSCPSADKLLKEIREKYKQQKVFVLAYHVDYWNRLGWKDKFSDHRFSERQSAYADNFKSNQVYTPQAIVNGKTEMIGSAAGQLNNAIVKFLDKSEAIKFSTQIKTLDNQQITINYATPIEATNQDLVLNLVEKEVSTDVKAGENSGRLLPHANVVRYYQVVNLKRKEGEITFDLPSGFKKENYSVIAFIQAKNQGEILGATETEF